MLNLIKMTVLLSATLAVTGCDHNFLFESREFSKATENGKTTIYVNCDCSTLERCNEYLRENCTRAELYRTEFFNVPTIRLYATCQE
jgi:hypothetical protein